MMKTSKNDENFEKWRRVEAASGGSL